MPTITLNDQTSLTNSLNDTTVSEIILAPGIWQGSVLSGALSERTIVTPVTIRGNVSVSNEHLTSVSGLIACTNVQRNGNLITMQDATTGSNLPLLYAGGLPAQVKKTDIVQLVNNNNDYLFTNTPDNTVSDGYGYRISKNSLSTVNGTDYIWNAIKVGSILSLYIAFVHLRLEVLEKQNDSLLIRSSHEIDTTKVQEWITNGNYSLIACVVNCAGNPATGEYVYDGGSIVYGYGGGSEPLPLFQTASPGSLLSLAGLCNVNFSNIDFTDSGVDDITSGCVNGKQSESDVVSAVSLSSCHDIVFSDCSFTA